MNKLSRILGIPHESEFEGFLRKFRIQKEEFNKTGYDWNELKKIKSNYIMLKPELEPTASDIVSRLFKAPKVHSIRYRIKHEEHVIEKIIRKKLEDPERVINIDNYTTELTDLVGVRVLHLYKDDWKKIHKFIQKTYELKETTKAYIREGDDQTFYKDLDCDIKVHPNNYRSVHYIIESNPTKKTFYSEIQVRTLFEEGWSEIDHDIRYPYNMHNLILGQYLNIFNRIAGSADEMGMYIKKLEKNFLDQRFEHQVEVGEKEQKILELKKEIDELKITEKEKTKLNEALGRIPVISSFDLFQNPLFSNYNPYNITVSELLSEKLPELLKNGIIEEE